MTGPPRRPTSVDKHSSKDAAPPPSQVFTRGRHGVVKTRPQNDQKRRSTSMDPSRRQQRSTRTNSTPRYKSTTRTQRATLSHVSIDNMSYGMSSDVSEGDHSIYSAPAPTPKKGDYPERREPSSSRTSPSMNKQQNFNKRELSPERSIDIQKQHSRMTRKTVDGTSPSVPTGETRLFQ